jgi:ribonucleoside-diphosphate reductase beta chain
MFKFNEKSHLEQPMFFGDKVDIARYDRVKYPKIDKLTTKQQGQYWRPMEVEVGIDSKDFKVNLVGGEQRIFTYNLQRQILLDTFQGREPALAFLPIASLPELETFIIAWTFFETIHSQSYTHIIRNIYPDPSVVFDGMADIAPIVDCAKDIAKYYDDLIAMNSHPTLWGSYAHKKALWMCLNAVNALEGIRFYVSFACSWNFAEQKKMEGNAKIIKLIARDENVHLLFTQLVIKLLPKDDPDFIQIKEECAYDVSQMFYDVINQEKDWAKFLFEEGSMIGLNERLLCDYVDFIGSRRMIAVGVEPFTRPTSNPLPWTAKWIAGSDVQVAPQEVELSSYVIGAVKQDVTEDTFKGFKL